MQKEPRKSVKVKRQESRQWMEWRLTSALHAGCLRFSLISVQRLCQETEASLTGPDSLPPEKGCSERADVWLEFRFGMVPSCRSLLKVHAIQRILRTPCTAEKIIRKLPLNGSVSYSTAAANSILHDSQFFALMKDRWKPDSDKFKTVPVCFSCFCSLWFSVAPTTVCSNSALQEFNLTKNIFRAMKQNANGCGTFIFDHFCMYNHVALICLASSSFPGQAHSASRSE